MCSWSTTWKIPCYDQLHKVIKENGTLHRENVFSWEVRHLWEEQMLANFSIGLFINKLSETRIK